MKQTNRKSFQKNDLRGGGASSVNVVTLATLATLRASIGLNFRNGQTDYHSSRLLADSFFIVSSISW
jgi:hypothetical protein